MKPTKIAATKSTMTGMIGLITMMDSSMKTRITMTHIMMTMATIMILMMTF